MTRKNLEFLRNKAIIIMACFVLLGCEKSTGALGLDLVIGSKAVLGTKRNIDIKSHTEKYDSIASTNPQYVLAGNLQDPSFGVTHHEFVTQFWLSDDGLSPDFGANPVVDSVKLVVPYSTYYGDTNVTTTMDVIELDDVIEDTTYYSNHVFAATRVLASQSFLPKPKSRTVIDGEVISPSMVLNIDTAWAGEKIIRGVKTNPDAFTNNNEFVKYFKGLKFNTNNTGNSILHFDIAGQNAVLRIYYRQHKDSTETQLFDLSTNINSHSVNFASFDYTNAEFDLSMQDTVNGEMETYIQSMGGVVTRIDMRALRDYKDSAFVINKAEFVLRVRPGSAAQLEAPERLAIVEDRNGEYIYINDVFPQFNPNFGGELETDALRDRKYIFNVSRTIHDFVNTEAVVNDLLIIPLNNAASSSRVVLGGSANSHIPLEFNIYFTRTN